MYRLLFLFLFISCNSTTTDFFDIYYESGGVPELNNSNYDLIGFERTGILPYLYFEYWVDGLTNAIIDEVDVGDDIPFIVITAIDSTGRFKIAIDHDLYVADYLKNGICVTIKNEY